MPLHSFIAAVLLGYATLTAPLFAATVVDRLPKSITNQLPVGYDVISVAEGNLNDDELPDFLVGLGRTEEVALSKAMEVGAPIFDKPAQSRPLLIFIRNQDGSYQLAKRNDHVILKMDEGGQCDPFEDGMEGLAISKRYSTVQNFVACGKHWSWYVTFKYSKELKDWIFHKEITETWILNPRAKRAEDDVLVRGRSTVISGERKMPVLFEDYRPK